MIYQISDTPDMVVETDSLDYVKKIVRAHPNCSIRELGTGKVYRPRLVPRQSGAGTLPPGAAQAPPSKQRPAAPQVPPVRQAQPAPPDTAKSA